MLLLFLLLLYYGHDPVLGHGADGVKKQRLVYSSVRFVYYDLILWIASHSVGKGMIRVFLP